MCSQDSTGIAARSRLGTEIESQQLLLLASRSLVRLVSRVSLAYSSPVVEPSLLTFAILSGIMLYLTADDFPICEHNLKTIQYLFYD
jgi:hypothetical protein